MAHKEITVKECSDCPFLYQNGEYPESTCKAAKRTWGMGYYEGGPAPKWCPLRKQPVLVKLGKR